MFENLKKIFNSTQNSVTDETAKSDSPAENRKVEIAACALFIEMAKADGEFSEEERKFIVSEMENTFKIDKDCVKELMMLAEERIKESVSLYEFTGVINNTFSQSEKLELIESLWKLIYKDEKLNAYEDQLIKRIAATINVEHKQIINAKLLVKEQLGLKK
jgi:uncharacterized tellurite resistance protein B-like protein